MRKKLFVLLFTVCMLLPFSAIAAKQSLKIEGDHGKLAAVIQRPDGKKQYPMVMIFHGFTSQKDRPLLTALADKLEANGIASIRFDFNGHGESEGRLQDMTVLNEIEDAKKVYAYVRALPDVTSVSIAGHSQGGVVASMTAGLLGTDKVKSLVLMAPAAVLREDSIRGTLFGVKYDPLNPPEYIEIMGGKRIGREYMRTNRNIPIYETAMAYQGPACMIHGTGDTIAPYTYSIRYGYTYAQSEMHLLDGFDHSFTQDVGRVADIATAFIAKQVN